MWCKARRHLSGKENFFSFFQKFAANHRPILTDALAGQRSVPSVNRRYRMATLNFRLVTKDGQDMALASPNNRIEVVADLDAQGWKIEFNTVDPIGVRFDNGQSSIVAPFEQTDEKTYTAAALFVPPNPKVPPTGTPEVYTLNGVLIEPNGTRHPSPEITFTFTASVHAEVNGIIVTRPFSVSDRGVTPTDPFNTPAAVKVIVLDPAGERVANTQVIWSIDPPINYVYIYDSVDAAPASSDMVGNRYVTLTDADGESELHIASILPVNTNVKAEIQGQDMEPGASVVCASLDYTTADAYASPTILALEEPPGEDAPGIVVRSGESQFLIRLPAQLPSNADLFFNINDMHCPLKYGAGEQKGQVQSIPYTYLNYDQEPPYYQTLKFYTQVLGTNPKASRSVEFPVYGVFQNRPSDDITHRPLPIVSMQRDPGPNGTVNIWMITPALEFTIPAYPSARQNVQIGLYLNGYYSGTSTPHLYNSTAPITSFGAVSNDIPAGQSIDLKIPFELMAGYDRNEISNVAGTFYLEYTAEVGGVTTYSQYPKRFLLTA
jgi:hypothetical protein